MKNLLFCFSMLLITVQAQTRHFQIENEKNQFSIKFKEVAGYVILPVSINGSTDLNFILDTGSANTIISNMDAVNLMHLKNATPVKITGLGKDSFELSAFISKGNFIQIGDVFSRSSEIILLDDDRLNFSSRLGLPVYGVLGYDLLKDFVLKIDYSMSKVHFYKHEYFYSKNHFKGFDEIPIQLINRKPYLKADLKIEGKILTANFLIDSGNSDPIWVYENNTAGIVLNTEFINDYLGYGLSGEIHGQRTYINNMKLGSYEIDSPLVSTPEKESIVFNSPNQTGSLGTEVLRRFTVVFDYENNKMFLKKNKYFNDKFRYNLSGMEVFQPNPQLPYLEVFYIRKGGPAEKAGIEIGDIIKYIDNKKISPYAFFDDNKEFKPGHKIELIGMPEIVKLFKDSEGKKVKIVYSKFGRKEEQETNLILENAFK